MKIKKIGEFGLINYLRKKSLSKQGYIGIGDDCAFIPPDVVITSDMMVEDVHFKLSYLKPVDIGHRATAACLSDLAAVGAQPIGILVSIILRPDIEYRIFKKIYQGINTVLKKADGQLLGGDLSQGKKIVLSMFGIGKTRHPIKRRGARPGDSLYLSGYPGLSEAGRLALKMSLSKKKYKVAIGRHTRPYPKLKLGLKLRKKVSAMIDLSDGLLIDLNHIADESKVGIEIDKVPIHPELKRLEKEARINAKVLALSGGEDFELIFSSGKILKGFFKIGRAIKGKGLRYKGEKVKPEGFEHFRDSNKR